jgi:uncharacterized protein (TIGR02246 family)
MKLFRRIALCLLSVGLGSCGPGGSATKPDTGTTTAQDRAAIDSVRNQYAATWKSANAEQMATLYTSDAAVLYPNQAAVVGSTAIQAYFKTFFDQFVQEIFELTSEEIEVTGPWAFDRGTYRWRATPRAGGPPIEDNGKYLVILRRQANGSWKVARDMDNSDRPQTQNTR